MSARLLFRTVSPRTRGRVRGHRGRPVRRRERAVPLGCRVVSGFNPDLNPRPSAAAVRGIARPPRVAPRPGLRACLQRAFGVGHGFEPEKCVAPARSWAHSSSRPFCSPALAAGLLPAWGPRCAPAAGLLPVLVTRPITFHPAWEVKHGSRTLLSENAPVAVVAYRRAVAGVDRIAGRFAGHSRSDRPRGVGASLPEISALRTMHREMPYPLVYRS